MSHVCSGVTCTSHQLGGIRLEKASKADLKHDLKPGSLFGSNQNPQPRVQQPGAHDLAQQSAPGGSITCTRTPPQTMYLGIILSHAVIYAVSLNAASSFVFPAFVTPGSGGARVDLRRAQTASQDRVVFSYPVSSRRGYQNVAAHQNTAAYWYVVIPSLVMVCCLS